MWPLSNEHTPAGGTGAFPPVLLKLQTYLCTSDKNCTHFQPWIVLKSIQPARRTLYRTFLFQGWNFVHFLSLARWSIHILLRVGLCAGAANILQSSILGASKRKGEKRDKRKKSLPQSVLLKVSAHGSKC